MQTPWSVSTGRCSRKVLGPSAGGCKFFGEGPKKPYELKPSKNPTAHDVMSTLYALISARLVWATSPDRTRKPPIRCLLYQPNKATNPDASIVQRSR